MKTILLTALAAFALVATLQAGEKNAKSTCCASAQAKGTTCSAKATASADKSACCSKETTIRKTNPFPVKGATLLMQFAQR